MLLSIGRRFRDLFLSLSTWKTPLLSNFVTQVRQL